VKDKAEHKIYIGTAGWSYPDWEGIVYPQPKPANFDQLSYIAQYFDVIEINSTFYHPPNKKNSESWIRRIEFKGDFKFTAKLHQKFTHERTGITSSDEKMFKDGIAPIYNSGRLGCILLQFPWSFKFVPENSQYLKQLIAKFSEYPLVVEVRHASWDNNYVFESLSERNVGFCNIDQPKMHSQLMPTQQATGSTGYVRLHGQNLENWFKEDAGRDERYDYLYSMEELSPWVQRILAVAKEAKETYAIANNHFRGKAATNALQLKFMVSEKKVDVPKSLKNVYPQLGGIEKAVPKSGQGTLF
jgi:uncharacterized protein YecE (DUF72 family)